MFQPRKLVSFKTIIGHIHCEAILAQTLLEQLELLSAGASPQVLEPDNLRTFVSSPQ
jgi:hypothetical protein